jgi:HlyD family secretion protein
MGMDRVIEKKKLRAWQWGLIGLAIVGVCVLVYRLIADASIRTYRVPAEQLVISTVEFGEYEDLIPIRGTIQPLNSVFLDSVDGGVVEETFVEEGNFVEAGQPLLQFSNSTLQLNVAQNDTQITEQLNNLKGIVNGFDKTKINTERELIDTEYKILTLERQRPRQEKLAKDGLIPAEQYEATLDQLDYLNKVHENIRSRQTLENKIRDDRMQQITVQISQLENNLQLAKNSFENLLVRAPIAGQLTSFVAEIGENKTKGERLGQIDVVDRYRIVASIDEFYVARVASGQKANFTLAGGEYTATVSKVYPEILEGTFNVDLVFDESPSADIRRGQTIQMNLTLGNSSETLLLPIGGFIQDTGGNWAFVLDKSGEYAVKRDLRTGRRNNRMIEVMEGLEAGERVITSSYGQMADMERIQLTE